MSNRKLEIFDSVASRIDYAIEIIKNNDKLKQKEIAQAIGISSPSLTRLKNGESKQPAGSTLMMFKEKFGVNPEWLISGIGVPFEDALKHDTSDTDIVSTERTIKPEIFEDFIGKNLWDKKW